VDRPSSLIDALEKGNWDTRYSDIQTLLAYIKELEKGRIDALEEALKAVESWRQKDHYEVLIGRATARTYACWATAIDAAEGAIANCILREQGILPRKPGSNAPPTPPLTDKETKRAMSEADAIQPARDKCVEWEKKVPA
jgi:hypothetical protein